MFNVKEFDIEGVTNMLCSSYPERHIVRTYVDDCLFYLKACAENEYNKDYSRDFQKHLTNIIGQNRGCHFRKVRWIVDKLNYTQMLDFVDYAILMAFNFSMPDNWNIESIDKGYKFESDNDKQIEVNIETNIESYRNELQEVH